MDPSTTHHSGIAGRMRERATAQLETQKDRATQGLGSVAKAVRDTTQHLRTQQHDVVARYADQAADQIERLSQRLREKNVGEIFNDAQALARRQPALFIGGAFAVGLLGARFLKSSTRDERGWAQRDVYPRQGGFSRGAFTAPAPIASEPVPDPNAYGNTVPRERS